MTRLHKVLAVNVRLAPKAIALEIPLARVAEPTAAACRVRWEPRHLGSFLNRGAAVTRLLSCWCTVRPDFDRVKVGGRGGACATALATGEQEGANEQRTHVMGRTARQDGERRGRRDDQKLTRASTCTCSRAGHPRIRQAREHLAARLQGEGRGMSRADVGALKKAGNALFGKGKNMSCQRLS